MSAPALVTAVDRDRGMALLRDMLRIRRFEEKCAELYGAGKIRGFLHLYIGEEAVAAGAMRALTHEDAIVATYREHGHALARGIDAGRLMAEMYGKQEGCSKGRGGSMHVFDAATRFYGGNAIVGGGLPIAVGLALADALSARRRVTACFFGDGAVAEGEFHESLNLAALWKLPVLFACENNLYAMGTRIERALSQTDVAAKARAYGITAATVDGMDVTAVEAATRAAADHIRAGAGPQFLEFRTYRFRAHSMFDAELYRDKSEIDAWKERDPIRLLAARLEEGGLLDAASRAGLDAEVEAEIAAAVAFAEAGTWEPVEQLTRDVYTRPLPLRPLDMATIDASLRKTRRLVIADEGWRSGSLSAEIAARVSERLFYDLEAPIARVCTAEVPIPYPKHLEDAALPQAGTIADAARALLH